MAEVTLEVEGGESELGDVVVRSSGLRGVVRTTRRRGAPSAVEPALAAALARQGLVPVGDPIAVEAQVAVTRSGAAPMLQIEPPRRRSAAGTLHLALVVEDDGVVRWAMAEHGLDGGPITVPIETTAPGTASRGIAGGLIGKVVQLVTAPIVDAVAGRLGAFFVRRWEAANRPHRLRLVGRDIGSLPDTDLTRRQAQTLAGGRALLLVHGTASSTLGAFRGMNDWLDEVRDRYENRVVAFDHPTLGSDPDENAAWLTHELQRLVGDGPPVEVDVLTHSRGGLVARTLAERAGSRDIRDGVLDVRSVTFVGTPNAGTALCHTEHLVDLLDTLTNVVGLVPGMPDALDVVLALVKQVASGVYDGLDGVMSMNPSGTWLRELNTHTTASPSYHALTSDFEATSGTGRLRRLRDLVTDRVFEGAANDLVVPTDGVVAANGSNLFPVASRLRLEPSDTEAVDHSSFFDHPPAVEQLRRWLLPPAEAAVAVRPPRPSVPTPRRARDELDELPMDAVDEALAAGDVARLRRVVAALDDRARGRLRREGGPAALAARGERPRPGTPEGVVVVVPGLLGTNLDVVDGDGRPSRVWLDPVRLVAGAFASLAHDDEGDRVRPAGLHRVHVPLLLALDRDLEVVPFAYDWRRPIAESGAALARVVRKLRDGGPGPVHVVAHSMGGLVARHAIAEDDEWEASGGRLVQLGTPNLGSFAVALALRGQDRTVTWLAAADLRHSAADLVAVLRGFPGLLEMLPSPFAPGLEGHEDFYEPGPLVGAARDDGFAAALAAARRSQEQRHEQAPLPPGTSMVLGTGRWTVLGHRRTTDGEVRFGRTRRGDGIVAHDLAGAEDVPTWYADTTHAGLLLEPAVLASLPELVRGETPSRLAEDDPARSRFTAPTVAPSLRGADLAEPLPSWAADHAAGDMTGVDREALAVGAAEGWIGAVADPSERTVHVQVVHGVIQAEQGPWLLGHVAGTPVTGAAGAIDRRLRGRLESYVLVGEYPEDAGEPLVIHGDDSAETALVVGLGPWGELTEPALAEGVTRVLLRYLAAAPDPGHTSVSAVLIGTAGEAGISVQEAVAGLVRGVLAANARSSGLGGGGTGPFVDEVRIVELYEDRALLAARAVREVGDELDSSSLGGARLRPAAHVRDGVGGLPGGRPADVGGDVWRRLVAHVDEQTGERLVMRLLGHRSAAPTVTNGLLRDVERIVGTPGTMPSTAPSWLTMLWHMLIPPELRHGLDGHVQLALDSTAAGLPWEMLVVQGESDGPRAMSLRHGMLRQLVSPGADTRIMRSDRSGADGRALVVGDPPTGGRHVRLPGARAEAEAVARALTDHGLDVTLLSYGEHDRHDASAEILTALYERSWEVLHIAAHGHHDPDDPDRSGVLLGADQVLRGEHMARLSTTPRLVVLNCCHLARVDGPTGPTTKPGTDGPLPRFAAGVAESLMRHGVPAVVAAGWAVDDEPAKTFAEVLYEQLLVQHAGYGDAVRRARIAAHDDAPDSATWGAYQCYGDASFRLRPSRSTSGGPRRPAGPSELVGELARLRHGATVDRAVDELAGDLDRLLDSVPSAWRELPACAEAIGRVCAERGDFDRAVEWYERAVRHPSADVTVRTLEQLVNLRTRTAGFDMDQVRSELDRLIALGETSERYALLGAAHKRLAASESTTRRRRAAMRESIDLYRKADRLGHHSSYALPNIAHLAAALPQGDRDLTDDERARLLAGLDDGGSGYWAAAARGDVALLRCLEGEASEDDVYAAYADGIAHGPTHRQWASVWQQCVTMGILAERPLLVRVGRRLRALAARVAPS